MDIYTPGCVVTTGYGRGGRKAMKKNEAIIKPFKLDEVKETLHGMGVKG